MNAYLKIEKQKNNFGSLHLSHRNRFRGEGGGGEGGGGVESTQYKIQS